jgi:integrase
MDGANSLAIAIIRLLAFTGARKSEIIALRWTEVDFANSCLMLDESKTGAKILALGATAREVPSSIPREQSSAWVFPATSGRGYFQGVDKVWRRLRELAGFPIYDFTICDIRSRQWALLEATAYP